MKERLVRALFVTWNPLGIYYVSGLVGAPDSLASSLAGVAVVLSYLMTHERTGW